MYFFSFFIHIFGYSWSTGKFIQYILRVFLGAYNDAEESVAYLVIYALYATHIFTLLQHHLQKPMCNQNIPRGYEIKKSNSIPRQAEVALGVLGGLRPQIITTFSTTRVVGCQPNAPAAFTPGEIPGTHFQRLS